MIDIAERRIKRELAEFGSHKETIAGQIKLEMIDDKWDELQAEILGPDNTPYAGGRFKLKIKIPTKYPFKAPEVLFTTYIWHPSVSSISGNICLDILKGHWAPALNIRGVLISIWSLLCSVEPFDPFDSLVSTQYRESVELFERTATHWCNVYGGGPNRVQEFDDLVQRLVEMGIADVHIARVALASADWNIDVCIDVLILAD